MHLSIGITVRNADQGDKKEIKFSIVLFERDLVRKFQSFSLLYKTTIVFYFKMPVKY